MDCLLCKKPFNHAGRFSLSKYCPRCKCRNKECPENIFSCILHSEENPGPTCHCGELLYIFNGKKQETCIKHYLILNATNLLTIVDVVSSLCNRIENLEKIIKDKDTLDPHDDEIPCVDDFFD